MFHFRTGLGARVTSGGGFEAFLSGFFDRNAVIKRVAAAERRVLSKFGAFVMRTARNSIKAGKGSAPPGHPPYAHASYFGRPRRGKASKRPPRQRYYFRDSILFAYEGAPRPSVVIGPFLFNKRTTPTIPELLELGGRHPETGLQYAPHPFMRPAFEKEIRDGLPKILKDCVSR